MSPSRELKLFGLDLTHVWDSVRVGIQQLLYGEESGILSRFYPHIEVRDHDGFERLSSVSQQGGDPGLASQDLCAVLLPDDQVLIRDEQFPLGIEAHLEEAVAQFAVLNSPFSSDETIWGWRLVSRGPHLSIRIALTSRSAVNDFLSTAQPDLLGGSKRYEVWAATQSAPIVLNGFDEGIRREAYHKKLVEACALAALVTVIGAGLLFFPSAWLSIKASQLEELLAETEARVEEVAIVRTELVDAQQSLSEVGSFFSQRHHYYDWLNALAAMTPDSVYLYRLSIEGPQLTIYGFAENAADYQGQLAASGLFSDLSAPTAFAYDTRAERERFSLVMSLSGENQ